MPTERTRVVTTGWRTLNGEAIPNIQAWVNSVAKDGQQVHVGTDSLQTGRFTQFVTVVAVLHSVEGRAANRVAYQREVVKRISSLRERLSAEVWRSLNLGLDLWEGPGKINIHMDLNPDPRHKSNQYVQSLVGAVVGQGFAALIKPEAWAASHAADHLVRTRGKLPKGFVAA